ncbi:MAG: TetR/AcrR family transcriptional regulator [Elusimicrobia bacterium]|nr:TetR/AcrR family transcriptional regulator [Elusimicrobiota bacterium]
MEHEGRSRSRLLETAAELIARSSYGTVSVDDICKRAGVHKGSFYHFFPSKSDLAVAALEDHWERARPEKDRVFSPQVPPLDRIAGWCELMRRNQTRRKESMGMVLGCPYTSLGSELSTTDEKIRRKCREIAERTCSYVESAVRDAQRDGLIPAGDAALKARELYTFAVGALQQAKIDDDIRILNDLKPAMFRLLRVHEAVER